LQDDQLRIIDFEQVILSHSGASKDYHWQISPMKTHVSANENVVYTCIGKDVSEIKLASARIAAAAKDLELVDTLQKLILPANDEIITDHLRVAASCISAAISGGDCWFFEWTNNGALRILIGDVTGHGTGPAMVTALVAGIVGSAKYFDPTGQGQFPVDQLLTMIGERLGKLPGQPYWMTASAIEIDLAKHELKWWSAGGAPVLVVSATGEVHFLSEASSPLGSLGRDVASGRIDFKSGDRVLLMTDGVAETQNSKGKTWNNRLQKDFMLSSLTLSASQARDKLLDALEAWRDGSPLRDDTTFVFVEAL
jgi:serine phosphatase RsbU (regulator of sigma subunit)